MDIKKYVEDKIKAHPKLHLISQGHSANGHVFVLSNHRDRMNSAVLSLSGLDKIDGDESLIKKTVDTRFNRVVEHLIPGEVPDNVKGT